MTPQNDAILCFFRECKHRRIKSIASDVYCASCGAIVEYVKESTLGNGHWWSQEDKELYNQLIKARNKNKEKGRKNG